jgi:hypothetical protein
LARMNMFLHNRTAFSGRQTVWCDCFKPTLFG